MGKFSRAACSKLESMHFYNKAQISKNLIWESEAKKLIKRKF